MLLSDDIVVARKRHRCFLCRCSIWPGQKYRRTSQVWEGSIERLCEHEECSRVGGHYYRAFGGWDEGYQGEDVYEWLRECHSPRMHSTRRRDYEVWHVGDMTRDERKVFSRMRQSQARYEIRHAMEKDRWIASPTTG